MAFDLLVETKSVHRLAFGHYLRTRQRLTNREWLVRQEGKFNPYHDELGRFTSPPGVTVSWGKYGSPSERRVNAGRRRDTAETASANSREEDSNSGELPLPQPKAPAAGFRSELVRDAVSPQTNHADTYFELNKRQASLNLLRKEAGPNPAPIVKADLDDFQKRLDADRARLDELSRVADQEVTEILRAGLAPIDVGAGAINIASGDGEVRDYLSVAGVIPIGGAVGRGGKVVQLGGAYKVVRRLKDYHAHHMPAKWAGPLSRGDGPSIAMLPEDHVMTKSYGGGDAAKAFRQKQKDLADEGDFKGAQQLEIDDIREKFGTRYDGSIDQVLKHTRDKGY